MFNIGDLVRRDKNIRSIYRPDQKDVILIVVEVIGHGGFMGVDISGGPFDEDFCFLFEERHYKLIGHKQISAQLIAHKMGFEVLERRLKDARF